MYAGKPNRRKADSADPSTASTDEGGSSRVPKGFAVSEARLFKKSGPFTKGRRKSSWHCSSIHSPLFSVLLLISSLSGHQAWF